MPRADRFAALPADDPERAELHHELHARPPTQLPGPSLVLHVALLNDGVSRDDECTHLRRLPGDIAPTLTPDDLVGNFLRLDLPASRATLKWERHTEFTRYVLSQPLPEGAWPAPPSQLRRALAIDAAWLGALPGRTIAAVELVLQHHPVDDVAAALAAARRWFGEAEIAASLVGNHADAVAAADFALRADGFERMLLLARPGTSATRAGRLTQRLLEIETYRMMALRGLPVAKRLAPILSEAEDKLAEITARLDDQREPDKALLDRLASLSARVERATAQHMYRFSATAAYAAIVDQRIDALAEHKLPGMQTIGEFMRRRLSPAIATVAATAQRLAGLSQRIERATALLRTRVDIATEVQSRQLLERLTRGQALQLQLQSTVEGLSVAAISYYIVGLVYYAAKAAHSIGLPVHPEFVAGASIPLALGGVALLVRRIHRRLTASH
jgi:uncharacterized membrane-anchored protein